MHLECPGQLYSTYALLKQMPHWTQGDGVMHSAGNKTTGITSIGRRHMAATNTVSVSTVAYSPPAPSSGSLER
jgi:hypothetical protein